MSRPIQPETGRIPFRALSSQISQPASSSGFASTNRTSIPLCLAMSKTRLRVMLGNHRTSSLGAQSASPCHQTIELNAPSEMWPLESSRTASSAPYIFALRRSCCPRLRSGPFTAGLDRGSASGSVQRIAGPAGSGAGRSLRKSWLGDSAPRWSSNLGNQRPVFGISANALSKNPGNCFR